MIVRALAYEHEFGFVGRPGRPRRGIVLVVILGMLSLLALLGVTFATYSGQAQLGSRRYAEASARPDAEAIFDFGLDQLIFDTSNVASALRGHSLVRDMYGNDAEDNGILNTLPNGNLMILSKSLSNSNQFTTNIPSSIRFDFTRWHVKAALYNYNSSTNMPTGPILPNNAGLVLPSIPQTLEVLGDNYSGNFHVFTLAWPEGTVKDANLNPINPITTRINQNYAVNAPQEKIGLVDMTDSSTALTLSGNVCLVFVLDGRFRNAFNGPGMTTMARYGNFRWNKNLIENNTDYVNTNLTTPLAAPGNPDYIGMDEDYDACDLENWFLAIQSADGEIVVPSFHRPGILMAQDWSNALPLATTPAQVQAAVRSHSKILRPRRVDNNDATTFPDLLPDPTTGKLDYDVDNDGDGKTDAVWLDLGYPVQRDATGTFFKPLFAFTVIGLNGRLPLNTAGNLQKRDDFGNLDWDHTSHLGYSVSEINPKYALQNTPSLNQYDNSIHPTTGLPFVDVAQTQLRNLLSGTYTPTKDPNNGPFNQDSNFVVYPSGNYPLPNNLVDSYENPSNQTNVTLLRNTTPVQGRWGIGVPQKLYAGLNTGGAPIGPMDPATGKAAAWFNPKYAGPGRSGNNADVDDDNFDTFDFGFGTRAEYTDFWDAAGVGTLPVERLRRGLYPFDVAGTGRVVQWDLDMTLVPPTEIANKYGRGLDNRGRIKFLNYFRPPGFPYEVDNTNRVGPMNTPYVVDTTNNLYHGYDSFRQPGLVRFENHTNLAAMPFINAASPLDLNASNPKVPTFENDDPTAGTLGYNINSRNPNDTGGDNLYQGSVVFGYPFGSLAMNTADEMNLYGFTRSDAAYTLADLEWLYRVQDRDSSTLTSRLSDLAPISFLRPNLPPYNAGTFPFRTTEEQWRGRRLFATESWETNAYAWAPDSAPVAPVSSSFLGSNPPAQALTTNFYNARFPSVYQANANYGTNGLGLANAGMQSAGLLGFNGTSFTNGAATTPSVAYRQRKINLNFPLPVSNNPDEQVRKKWIRETYSMILATLPPQAIDTPEEVAKISQFVVNIVDFRDPDAAMTHFVNQDLSVTAPTATVPTRLYFTNNVPAGVTAEPLEQYGMEYNPIAINEVLAYQFHYKPANANVSSPYNRLFIELVNTLTSSANLGGAAVNPSDLDLAGWEFILVPDKDERYRPDPTTGQPHLQQIYADVPANIHRVQVSYSNNTYLPADPNDPTALPADTGVTTANRVPSQDPNGGGIRTYTVSNTLPTANDERGTPTVDQQHANWTLVPPVSEVTAPGQFYWLYLRRPANPLADLTLANEPKVVVDSIRFPFCVSTVTGKTDPNTQQDQAVPSGPPTIPIYSVQRLQPYRGGQIVPTVTGHTPPVPPSAYGYSEQSVYSPVGTASGNFQGRYGKPADNAYTTMRIEHTIGGGNNDAAGNPDSWDLFAFQDRDFTSVAELLMVPGCPPGLFTKQFVENDLPKTALPAPVAAIPPPTPRPTMSGSAYFNAGTMLPTPRTFPYLPDEFYYSGRSTFPDLDSTKQVPLIGGWSGAGWHRMLEFFEVPSSSFGAIGLAADAQNFDWARQDLKPGLLNLNLIIDEEVFFGLIDDPNRLNRDYVWDQTALGPVANPNFAMPRVVTQVEPAYTNDIYGYPTTFRNSSNVVTSHAGSYAIPNRGYLDLVDRTATNFNYANVQAYPFLKAAFSDFLKLRHGGSGFLFAYGTERTGHGPLQPQYPFANVAAERPFRSLSYPDIDMTVMRPAALPPSAVTTYAVYDSLTSTYTYPYSFGSAGQYFLPASGANSPYIRKEAPSPERDYTESMNNQEPPTVTFAGDPGVKNPFFDPGLIFPSGATTYDTPTWWQVGPAGTPTTRSADNGSFAPMTPPRRLFQVPDFYNPALVGAETATSTIGHGSELGNGSIHQFIQHPNLTNSNASLAVPNSNPNNTLPNFDRLLLGGNPPVGGGGPDRRNHPYFRNEWLQKVMNLTTVRTHQYAAWITVGFFEVTQQGNVAQGVPDRLGAELGKTTGQDVRYRGFFVLDRTKAVGFNSVWPLIANSSFRDVVLYRRRIE